MNEIEILDSCPKCSGLGRFLGQLGSLEWFRCESCGWDFSREAEEEKNDPALDDYPFGGDAADAEDGK